MLQQSVNSFIKDIIMKKSIIATFLASMLISSVVMPMPDKPAENKDTQTQETAAQQVATQEIAFYKDPSMAGMALGMLVNLYPYQSATTRAAATAATFLATWVYMGYANKENPHKYHISFSKESETLITKKNPKRLIALRNVLMSSSMGWILQIAGQKCWEQLTQQADH